jgi:hypothetical protein
MFTFDYRLFGQVPNRLHDVVRFPVRVLDEPDPVELMKRPHEARLNLQRPLLVVLRDRSDQGIQSSGEEEANLGSIV